MEDIISNVVDLSATAAPFVTVKSYANFASRPHAWRVDYARRFVLARHESWSAAVRLSFHGLIEPDLSDAWINETFGGEDDVVRYVRCERAGIFCRPREKEFYERHDRGFDAMLKDSEHYLDRRLLKNLGLLKVVTPAWCVNRFCPRNLAKAILQTGKAGQCERDELADMLKGDPRGLAAVLHRTGRLTPDCGPDWYADRKMFGPLNRLKMLTPELGMGWFVSKFSRNNDFYLYRALKAANFFPAHHGPDWYAKHFRYSLPKALKRAGLMKRLDPDWCVQNFHEDDLPKVLAQIDLRGVDREWLAKHVQDEYWFCHTKDHWLIELLRKTGQLTADAGVEWYSRHLRMSALLQALRETGLLTAELGLEWFKDAFGDTDVGVRAMTDAGMRCDRNEYASVFTGQTLLDTLKGAGLVADREWCAEHFKGGVLISALREFGSLTGGAGRDWYASKLSGKDLLTALDEADLLTSDAGRDWYARAFDNGGVLLDALRKAGLVTAEPGREWYVTAFGGAHRWRKRCRPDALFAALKESGLMTAEPGRDWYAALYRDKPLFMALDACGLLTADPGHEWYALHFRGRAMFEVLKRLDMFQAGSADAILSEREYGPRVERYREMALFRAGLLEEGTHRWYAAHLEQEDLYVALRGAGLLQQRVQYERGYSVREDFSWYGCRLSDEPLLKCLVESGLLATMPSRCIRGYFPNKAMRKRAFEAKRQFWKHRRYPFEHREGPYRPGHDNDETWTISETDSRRSGTEGTDYVESSSSGDELMKCDLDGFTESKKSEDTAIYVTFGGSSSGDE